MNAKGESYCICTQEYTGDLCEKKTGCYGDPCKYGKCTNDPKDLTKFTCKCDEGIVGPKCDISINIVIYININDLELKILNIFNKRIHAFMAIHAKRVDAP